jgi:diketogulonate reductase-like aldo/keto reductase
MGTRRQTMTILQETCTLSNGVEIPKLGQGTWFISDSDVVGAVKDAAGIGYRHIDTAQAYRNEKGVGEGIRTSGIDRDDFFVTTKLEAGVKSYKKAVTAIDDSLKTMGLDYIDMMIIHSPQPWNKFRGEDRYFEGNREAWRALEEAFEAGKLRAIGLSNFEQADIDNIVDSASVQPMVNQILAHIGSTPTDLIEYSREKGMLVEAYSPMAHGELMRNSQISEIAERYGVSVPRLSIRYVLQLGLLALPKTANPAHMRDNADVDFSISDDDMEVLKAVEHIDYGDSAAMPVFGGELRLKSMASMAWAAVRR